MATQAIQKLPTIVPWPSNSCGGLTSWPDIPPRTDRVRDSGLIQLKISLQRSISQYLTRMGGYLSILNIPTTIRELALSVSDTLLISPKAWLYQYLTHSCHHQRAVYISILYIPATSISI